MPTDLPPRRAAPLQSSRDGNLAFAIAVLLMLAISAVLLWLQPSSVAAATAGPSIQAR